MARIHFTPNLERHVQCPEWTTRQGSVGAALAEIFAEHPVLRSYILDDQGALRRHINIFIDGEHVRDRRTLSDEIGEESEVYVMQALSGG